MAKKIWKSENSAKLIWNFPCLDSAARKSVRTADAGEVNELLNSALDAGLNVIDTAAAYKTSEELIGEAVGKAPQGILSADEMRCVRCFYAV